MYSRRKMNKCMYYNIYILYGYVLQSCVLLRSGVPVKRCLSSIVCVTLLGSGYTYIAYQLKKVTVLTQIYPVVELLADSELSIGSIIDKRVQNAFSCVEVEGCVAVGADPDVLRHGSRIRCCSPMLRVYRAVT